MADSLVQSAVDSAVIPGAVLLVGVDGIVIHEKAFGYAHLYGYDGERLERPVRMSTQTVFDLASLTKVFATTFGTMLLVDRGMVDLDAPVKTYLQSFTGVSKDSVTVRHLLNHTSGLHQWKPIYYHADNADDVLEYISSLELNWPVGRERHYSDLGFMLLGQIIATVTGKPLDVFLDEELYRTFDLESTGYLPRKRGMTGFAATSHGNPFEYKMVADDDFGYLCDENVDDFTGWRNYTLVGEVNDGNAFHANQGVAGHAGLFSTAGDLNTLLGVLLNRGMHNGRRHLTEETLDLFLTRDRHDNGLGWAMSKSVLRAENLPDGAFGHTGFTGTYALAVPESGLSILLLTNRQNLGVDESGRYNSLSALRKQVAEVLVAALQVSS